MRVESDGLNSSTSSNTTEAFLTWADVILNGQNFLAVVHDYGFECILLLTFLQKINHNNLTKHVTENHTV